MVHYHKTEIRFNNCIIIIYQIGKQSIDYIIIWRNHPSNGWSRAPEFHAPSYQEPDSPILQIRVGPDKLSPDYDYLNFQIPTNRHFVLCCWVYLLILLSRTFTSYFVHALRVHRLLGHRRREAGRWGRSPPPQLPAINFFLYQLTYQIGQMTLKC